MHVGDFATGFLDDNDTGGYVPRIQTKLPETVETTHGHVSEIEGRGAIAANAVRAQGKVPVEVEVGIG